MKSTDFLGGSLLGMMFILSLFSQYKFLSLIFIFLIIFIFLKEIKKEKKDSEKNSLTNPFGYTNEEVELVNQEVINSEESEQ